jgi:SagB-type dehydrogenase family enzyme
MATSDINDSKPCPTMEQLIKFHEWLNQDQQDEYQEIKTTSVPHWKKRYAEQPRTKLPEGYSIPLSIEETLTRRRSNRTFDQRAVMPLAELSTLLKLSYGVRRYRFAYEDQQFPLRMAPSAGGLQSTELYLVLNQVEGLNKGLYYFDANNDELALLEQGYFRRKVVEACSYQEWITNAAVVLFLTSDLEKLFWKYGHRAYRMVHVDAGIVAENLHLVATALGTASCMISGFIDKKINLMLNIDAQKEFTVLLIAVGKPVNS